MAPGERVKSSSLSRKQSERAGRIPARPATESPACFVGESVHGVEQPVLTNALFALATTAQAVRRKRRRFDVESAANPTDNPADFEI